MAPVVPVLVIHDVTHARPMAEALVAGGLPTLEVTLRTPAALDAIREMAHVPGGVVGAGTLLTPADVHAALEAGARVGVSPGVTELCQTCARLERKRRFPTEQQTTVPQPLLYLSLQTQIFTLKSNS